MPPPVRRTASSWNARTVTAPIAAVVMAGLLYTYAITSIRAAKRNAQLHREADGGQLDMRKESLRRHGVLDPVQGTSGIDLFTKAQARAVEDSKFLTEKQAKPLGADQRQESGTPRTQNEGILENYRGPTGMQKLKDERSQE